MGRAQKAKQRRQVARAAGTKLGELDYLRLVQARAQVNDAITRGQQDVAQAQGLAQQRLDGARRALVAQFEKIAPKYKLNTKQHYSFDDKRRLLIPSDKPT